MTEEQVFPQPPAAPDTLAPLAAAASSGPDGTTQMIEALARRLEQAEKMSAAFGARLATLERTVPEIMPAVARQFARAAGEVDDEPAGEDPRGRVFLAQVAGDGTWTEALPVAGALTAMTPGDGWRNCSSSSDSSALILANSSAAAFAVVLEIADPPNFRYVRLDATIPPPADPDLDYVLAWNGSTQSMQWVETTEDVECPPPPE